MRMDWESLSAREAATIELAVSGMTDAEIAEKLRIGPTSVRTYWARLRSKLGGVSRIQAVNAYRRHIANAETLELDNYRSLSNYAALGLLLPKEGRLIIKSSGLNFAKLLGKTAEEITGKDLNALLPSDQVQRLAEMIAMANLSRFYADRGSFGTESYGVILVTLCEQHGEQLIRLFHAPCDCLPRLDSAAVQVCDHHPSALQS